MEFSHSSSMRSLNVIKNLLLEKCPDLDINGGEKMILDTCKHDLYLYCMWLMDEHRVTDPLFIEYFTFFILGFELGIEHEIAPILTSEMENEYDKDCDTFAQQLVNEWYAKFLVRIQVRPTKTEDDKKNINGAFVPIKMIFTPQEMEEIHHYVAVILLKNGERCFITTMIDNLVRGVLMRLNPKKTDYSAQEKINLISSIGNEARRLTDRHGPLIFLFPDSNYFKAHMREWRGDAVSGQIL